MQVYRRRIARGDWRVDEAVAATSIAFRYRPSTLVIAIRGVPRSGTPAACARHPRLYGPFTQNATTPRRGGAHGNLCPGTRGLARRLVLATGDPAPDGAWSRGVRANSDRRRRTRPSPDTVG